MPGQRYSPRRGRHTSSPNGDLLFRGTKERWYPINHHGNTNMDGEEFLYPPFFLRPYLTRYKETSINYTQFFI
ncbi:hypothetical protein CALK_2343 [Chitinivibrio alkaliphilus ACht1]|uniref:Uncharacterized protein n=1 Tax=Chitinivibrio alkaliphilus ACht1 TaxID=1313304 RepID=U7D4C7_9BACT|nr:hypothetical protein CALK_2343 [Chitinivibrio alkaliphilus ACht1]